MPEEGFSEKRGSVRFLISIPLKYAKVGIQQFTSAVTKDISAEGLGLITAQELPSHAEISVCLAMPDNGEEIPLDAEVLWSKKDESGNYRSGLKIKQRRLKPIPLVLRTLNSKF
ncbi:MAG: PilZ domain-containing protein [Candidatus Omnitrophica bacterium]|nr:PilZ domain-containing protein [Candidatus Omnitrophota bacterium]